MWTECVSALCALCWCQKWNEVEPKRPYLFDITTGTETTIAVIKIQNNDNLMALLLVPFLCILFSFSQCLCIYLRARIQFALDHSRRLGNMCLSYPRVSNMCVCNPFICGARKLSIVFVSAVQAASFAIQFLLPFYALFSFFLSFSLCVCISSVYHSSPFCNFLK